MWPASHAAALMLEPLTAEELALQARRRGGRERGRGGRRRRRGDGRPPRGAAGGEPGGVAPSREVFFGTQHAYVFFRLHQTLCDGSTRRARLRRAAANRDGAVGYPLRARRRHRRTTTRTTPTSRTRRRRADGRRAAVGDDAAVAAKARAERGAAQAPGSLSLRVAGGAFEGFLANLYGLHGSVDNTRYEDACRQLMGNKACVLHPRRSG